MSTDDPLAGFNAGFRQAAHLLGCKRTHLRRSAGEITTLVLGSSHGDYGFDPGPFPGSFNLCSTSQDLRHSHAIYKRLSRGLPQLKTVVVFFSVFSPGHVLEKSPTDRVHAVALHDLLDLNLTYSEPDVVRVAGSVKTRLADWNPDVAGRSGFFPGLMTSSFPESYGAEARAADHMKLNGSTAALIYLAAMTFLAHSLGHRLVLAIPPARSDYRHACGAPSSVLFRSLTQMRSELQMGAFDVFNLWHDASFTDRHFCDFDHLDASGEGPAMLSGKLAAVLGARPA